MVFIGPKYDLDTCNAACMYDIYHYHLLTFLFLGVHMKRGVQGGGGGAGSGEEPIRTACSSSFILLHSCSVPIPWVSSPCGCGNAQQPWDLLLFFLQAIIFISISQKWATVLLVYHIKSNTDIHGYHWTVLKIQNDITSKDLFSINFLKHFYLFKVNSWNNVSLLRYCSYLRLWLSFPFFRHKNQLSTMCYMSPNLSW